jgi:hypothetical protein
MSSNQVMNQYEGALYEIVRILLLTVVEMGADKNVLMARMRSMAAAARQLHRSEGAAAIELLLQSIAKPADYTGTPPS